MNKINRYNCTNFNNSYECKCVKWSICYVEDDSKNNVDRYDNW